MIYSLVYVSAATPPVTRQVLLDLLQQCRASNSAREITGLLLYREGTYLQLIEGSRERVETLYAAIQADERHHDVTTVRTREQAIREFPDWAMGFGDVADGHTEMEVFARAPAPQTATEAEFVRELLVLLDPPAPA